MTTNYTDHSFTSMLKELREGYELSQKAMADRLGISTQYYHDLEKGRRTPSVAVVEFICKEFGRGPVGIKTWHYAGAKAHGWKI